LASRVDPWQEAKIMFQKIKILGLSFTSSRTQKSLLAIVTWFAVSTCMFGQDAKPRMMFVKVEQATVHCGPDKTYYPTSLLKRGDSVDVYHQTDNGWAAIRPPQGSFDWLAAENAYLLPGGTLAEVVGNS
jgi:SH3-like domain-containing protein